MSSLLEHEPVFGPASERKHEPTETLKKVRDIQMFAQYMISRDARISRDESGFELRQENQHIPSLDWSYTSEDEQLKVYAIAKYDLRAKNRPLERLTVGCARNDEQPIEVVFTSAMDDLDALASSSTPNAESDIERLHAAFEELFGFEEDNPQNFF